MRCVREVASATQTLSWQLVLAAAFLICASADSAEVQKAPGAIASRPKPIDQATALKQEAVTIATELAKAYPEDTLVYALLGSAYYNTGQSDEATRHLKRCLELSPNQTEAYEILARISYEKGDLQETTRLCDQALKQGPPSAAILNRLGRAYLDLGKSQEATRTLQKAVALPHPDSESFHLLAQSYAQGSDFKRAKENFKRAIDLTPDHTQAYFGLFTACVRLGEEDEAAKHREQFFKLEAADRKDLSDRNAQEDTLTGLPTVRETVARTLFGAGQIHRVHQQPERAAELFQKSAGLDGINPVYRSALESLYLERKDPARGVKAFEELVSQQPTNGLNHLFLGRFQSRMGSFEEAERSYQKVQQLVPTWAEGYSALAELYLRANRKVDQTKALAEKALEIDPSASRYFLLAVACFKNNDKAGALEAAKRAQAMNPEAATYRQFIQQLEAAPKN